MFRPKPHDGGSSHHTRAAKTAVPCVDFKTPAAINGCVSEQIKHEANRLRCHATPWQRRATLFFFFLIAYPIYHHRSVFLFLSPSPSLDVIPIQGHWTHSSRLQHYKPNTATSFNENMHIIRSPGRRLPPPPPIATGTC